MTGPREKSIADCIRDIGALNKPWNVRRDAARALAGYAGRARSAVPYLVDALSDPEVCVRWAAIETLGEIGDNSALPVLSGLLQNPHPVTRKNAALAMAKCEGLDKEGIEEIVAAAGTGRLEQRDALEALGAVGSAAVPYVEQALRDGCWGEPGLLIESLARLGEESSLELIAPYLEQGDCRLRQVAELALVRIGDLSVLLLEPRLKAADWKVRLSAARALGALGPEAADAAGALAAALVDDHWRVRRFAAKALGEIGQSVPEAFEGLARRVRTDRFEKVRRAALQSVAGLFGGHPDLPLLLAEALGDEDHVARSLAALGLARQTAGSLPGDTLVDLKALMLEDESGWARNAAAIALQKHAPLTLKKPVKLYIRIAGLGYSDLYRPFTSAYYRPDDYLDD